MLCPSCQTSNFRDYKYCRECGTQLPPSPPPGISLNGSSQDPQVEVLLEQALARSAAGEVDEAIGAVQGALAVEPDCAPAHSLLGELYEKQNRTPEAVRAYERALELNPSSNRDRERLALLAAPAPVISAWPPKRIALVTGVAAGLAVFGIGVTVVARQSSGTSRAQGGSASYQPAVSHPMPLPTPPVAAKPGIAPGTSVAANAGAAGNQPGVNLPYKITAGAGVPSGTQNQAAPVISLPRGTTAGTAGLPFSTGAVVPPGQSPAALRPAGVTAPNPNGLPVATIGEVVPLATPPGGPAQPGASPGGPGVTATFGPGGATPANTSAQAPRPNGSAPGEHPQTEKRNTEPFETDSGFIKIEPSENGGGAAQKRTPAPSGQPVRLPPSISLSFSSDSGSAAGKQNGKKAATTDERKKAPVKPSGDAQ